MRSFVLGLFVLVLLSVTILSLRPGGIRRQLRFAARRLRIALVLGGIYVIASGAMRILSPQGAVADWGPPVLAAVLAGVFVVLAQETRPEQARSSRP